MKIDSDVPESMMPSMHAVRALADCNLSGCSITSCITLEV